MPCARAYSPISRWNAGPASPTSPMSPITSHRVPGVAREHVDGRAHRVGIRVVRVVEHDARPPSRRARRAGRGTARNAAEPGARPRPATRRRPAPPPSPRAHWRPCGGPAPRASCARVPAGVAMATSLPSGRSVQSRAHVGAVGEPEGRRRARPPRAAAARHTAACASSALTIASAAARQRGDRVRVLGGDFGHARHELLVLALRVVDDDDRRPRDRREVARLAAMVHAELDHRGALRRRRAAAASAAARSRC